MPPYRHGSGEVPRFRVPSYTNPRRDYLMPQVPHDTSTMLSQYSMSPSSSVGPDQVQGRNPFLEVPPRPEDLSQSLMGISPRLMHENTINDIGELSFDAALGTDDVFGTSYLGQRPLCPPQIAAPSDLLERLHSELEMVEKTVEEISSHQGLPQLYDVQDLLKSRLSSFETTIQSKIESDEQPGFSCKLKDRYLCRLCPYGHRKVYKLRGTFKRHIAMGHHPRYEFRCPSSSCDWTSFRRDKVHDHFRNNHRHSGRLGRDQINRIEKRFPPPVFCEICWKVVEGWDEYFLCVFKHCRLREDDSSDTSASQSRRSSGDSGSGANGGGGNFNGGGLFGGTQNLFPPGSGNGHMNGGSFYSNTDQHYLSQASSYSNEMELTSLSCQSLPGAMNPDSKGPTSFRRQTFHHSALRQSNRAKAPIRGTEALPGHRQPLRRSTTESSLSSTNADSDVQSPSRIPHPQKLHSADNPIRENSLASLFKRHLQRPVTPESDVLDNKECKNCGHIMSDCTSCHSLQLSADRCHICRNKSSQKVAAKPYQLPKFRVHEAAVDQAADCTSPEGSATQVLDKPLQLALQVSRENGHSELTEKHSSRIRDDAVNSPDTSSKENASLTTTTMSTGSRNWSQTCLLETPALDPPDGSLSMTLIPKHLPSSTHETLNVGIQQRRETPSVNRLFPYVLLELRPSSNPHHGLGLYGYQRPKFNLDQGSAVGKMISHLVPSEQCLNRCTGMPLSTDLTPSIRHGRAKLSRSCGTPTHSSQECLQHCPAPTPVQEAASEENHQKRAMKSLGLVVAQSSFALSKRLKRHDNRLRSNRPVPSKHILSRKKYKALRTKLQGIAMVLALRKSSSKAHIFDPERSNSSYLKSIIPTGSYLKSPILDFDLSVLDIQSSLPLLLEAMSSLQPGPKGNTSAKLTDYIYDSDDEMHLMLMILMPLIKKLLWMPTPLVDASTTAAIATLEV